MSSPDSISTKPEIYYLIMKDAKSAEKKPDFNDFMAFMCFMVNKPRVFCIRFDG